MPASTSRHTGAAAPTPVSRRAVGRSSGPESAAAARQRSTSWATASNTARARSAGPWAASSPMSAAPARGRHHGARAPPNQGTAVTPRPPGGDDAAWRARSSGVRPTTDPNQASSDPAADSPPSTSHAPSAARVTARPDGGGTGLLVRGTETLAVVPQLTMGAAAVAPQPRTSHCRSPPPTTTGVPAGSPTAAADAAVTPSTTSPDGTTGGSRLATPSGRPTDRVVVVETGARGQGGIGDDRPGQPPDHQVPGGEHPRGAPPVAGPVGGDPGELARHPGRVRRFGRPSRTPGTAASSPAGRTRGSPGRVDAPWPRRDRSSGGHPCTRRLHPGEPAGNGPGQGAARRLHRRPPRRRVLLGPPRVRVVGGEGHLGRPDQPVGGPQGRLGDGGAEVQGEDHRPCTTSASRRAVVPGSGAAMTSRPTARPAPPPRTTSRASSTGSSWPSAPRPPEEEDRTPHALDHPPDGPGPGVARRLGRDRDLEERCPEVVGHDRGPHHVVRGPRHPAVPPVHGLHQGLEPGLAGVLEYAAQQLEGGGAVPVVGGDPGHHLDAAPAVAGGPLHTGHQPVVEFEGRTGQSRAVEGEVRPMAGAHVTRPGQVREGLGGGQDPVAVRQRRGQRGEVVGVALDRRHPGARWSAASTRAGGTRRSPGLTRSPRRPPRVRRARRRPWPGPRSPRVRTRPRTRPSGTDGPRPSRPGAHRPGRRRPGRGRGPWP